MVDAGVVCVGESTGYRVLSDADLLSRWKRSVVCSGEYNFRPKAPDQESEPFRVLGTAPWSGDHPVTSLVGAGYGEFRLF